MTTPGPSTGGGRPVPGPPPAIRPVADGQTLPHADVPAGVDAEAPVALHPGVAAALSRLEELDGAPVAEHVEVLDAVHRLLQDALATLDGA